MRKSATDRGRDFAEQSGNDFLRQVKQDSRAIAPTPDQLREVARKLKWRLKRKPGVSAAAELQRRIRSIGTFARLWHIDRIEDKKYAIRIWLLDDAGESAYVDAKRGISDKAGKAVGGKFKNRLEKLAEQVTGVF